MHAIVQNAVRVMPKLFSLFGRLPGGGYAPLQGRGLLTFLLLVFAIAVATRLFVVSRYSRLEIVYVEAATYPPLFIDEALNVAFSIATKRTFADPFGHPTGPTAHLPPAYPAAMAAVYTLFGIGMTGAVIRHLISATGFGVLFCLMPWFSARVGMGQLPGLLAAAFGAAVPLFRSSEALRGRDEWLAGVLLMITTVMAFRVIAKPQAAVSLYITFGALWGAMMYVHPSTLPVFLAEALLFLIAGAKPWRVGCCAIVLLLAIAPWTIRNRLALGHWFFIRDNLGLELAVSNADGAQASLQANHETHFFCTVHPVCSPAQRERIRQSGEYAFNQELQRQALEWIFAHPITFGIRSLQRYGLFWTDLPSNGLFFIGRLLVSVLSVAGVVALWRNRMYPVASLLTAVLLLYPATYSLFQYSNRYVVVVSFALYTLAGYAVIELLPVPRQLRERSQSSNTQARRTPA
jgi:hypothetical protein